MKRHLFRLVMIILIVFSGLISIPMAHLCPQTKIPTSSPQNSSSKEIAEPEQAQGEIKKLHTEVEELYQAGKYDQALPVAQQALDKAEKIFGPEHALIAESLNNLAQVYKAKGEYTNAELLLVKSLAMYEKVLGSEHLSVAGSLHNLAALYNDKGEYTRAEPLYVRSLTIREKALGTEHILVANTLNSLAVHYLAKGDYPQAEPLLARALAIREKLLGAEHPSVAVSLHNLAGLHWAKGEYARAESLYMRSLAIREKVLGAEHPSVAESLNNLAGIYRVKGDYAKAELFLVKSLAIYEKALGVEHPSITENLNHLAVVYQARGEYSRTEPLLVRSLTIREKALGVEHPSVASSLSHLAVFYQATGEITQAVGYRSRSNDAIESDLARNLVSGSENQKVLYLKKTANKTDLTISLHVQTAPQDPAALRAALTVILRRKGRGLDAMTNALAILRNQQRPKTQKLLDDYANLASQISVLTLRGPGKKKPEEHHASMRVLEDQKEKLENEISRLSGEFKVQTTPITLEAIQKLIPANAALVEYALYQPFDVKTGTFGKPRYVAYVLRQRTGAEKQGSGFRVHGSKSEAKGIQSQPDTFSGPNSGSKEKGDLQKVEPGTRNPEPKTLLWVDLGEAEAVDQVVGALRQALGNSKKDFVKEVQPLSKVLDTLVMKPVRNLIGSTRHLLVSPDGALNLIPFSALVDENGKFLVENYTLTYLTSGRDLLRMAAKVKSQEPPLVMADPDYADGTGPQLSRGAVHRLSRLSGTRKEGQEIKAMFPEAQLKMKSDATEAILKQAVRPKMLHIATHGYFLEDVPQELAVAESPQSRQALAELLKDYENQRELNPLLRSMLFFAGANRGGTGDNDGVMTALEAAQLNLWGTKLVVLSACDTGLGDVKNGDGVYGLRRALVLAGSEAQMMSLWAVSDQGTQELMTEYYTRLKAGEGRSEALRNTQLKLLKDPKRQHPFYWASFIQSGDWTKLAE
ncbi:MAG: CHAT domain-containing protein [Acidobacteria bacterium]|nr:CHAT domain-containing protein [Acidobacteriota bacterium]